ncbi:hypothetical protein MA16_Dca006853 [Dendrobium catenatum]|uniref:Uncharacterized protein n=1 Tax=Dendrobium catenatum TaxID=906689 RepID=A0A2I0VSY8_9ASPA|nr:hypothetical protein MA16_Dca006853 [Dendrobium catenatum]
MEFSSSSQVHKSLPSYWRRRTSRRVGDYGTKKKSSATIRLGGRKKRWRSWKVVVVVRPVLKLARLRVPPPVQAMKKLREAYTDAMVLLSGALAAKKGGSGASMGAVWDRRIPRGREEGLKGGDFEKRLMLHLYNSVIATR